MGNSEWTKFENGEGVAADLGDEPAQRLHSLKVVRQLALCGSDQRRSVWQQAAADSPGSDRQRFPRCYEKQENGRKKMANTGMTCYCIS